MKKRNIPIYAFAALLLIIGTLIIIYPHVRQLQYKLEAVNRTHAFLTRAETVQQDTPSLLEDLYQKMVAYNEHLFETHQSGLIDSEAYEKVDFSIADYGFPDEMIGYLSIPAMDLELPIYLGASGENMDKGAVHLSQTSLPVGGINTNTVIAAHRGAATAAMFRHIEVLKPGDPIYVTTFAGKLAYKVTDTTIISPNDRDAVLIQEGKDMLTLVTCHPFPFNYQRYVVYCQRVTDG